MNRLDIVALLIELSGLTDDPDVLNRISEAKVALKEDCPHQAVVAAARRAFVDGPADESEKDIIDKVYHIITDGMHLPCARPSGN